MSIELFLLASTNINKASNLVDVSKDIKNFGCRLFIEKIGGVKYIRSTRFVAKWFCLKEGVGYDTKSMQVLFTMEANYDLGIWRMVVKTLI